eukprot:PRCOL_00006842-RA
MVGLDCEWRPQTDRAEPMRPVALCQLASRDACVLVDLFRIAAEEGDEGVERVGAAIGELFEGDDTQLVGYVVGYDLRRLASSYPRAESLAGLRATRVVDLARVARALGPKAPGAVRRARGLSGLARATLGAPLDKRQQCSDWEDRPLSSAQQEYAALDAHACVQIWDAWVSSMGSEAVAEAYERGGAPTMSWSAVERPSAD